MNLKGDYAGQRERDLFKESGELNVFWSGDDVFPMENVGEKYIQQVTRHFQKAINSRNYSFLDVNIWI